MKRQTTLAPLSALLIAFSLLAPPAAAAAQSPATAGATTTPPQQQQRPAPPPPRAGSPAAQRPTPAPQDAPDDEEDVVRITTNLVQVDAVVTDREGRLVTDLGPEDFEIIADGARQPITNFSFVSAAPAAPGAATPADAPAAKKPADAPAPPVPPARLRPEQVRRTVALVVDDLNASFESIYYVRRALKKFVAEQMQEGDLVSILSARAGMGALQQFTSDRRLLLAAIEAVRWYPSGRGRVGAFAPIEAEPFGPSEDERSARGAAGGRDEDDERGAGGESLDEFRDEIFTVGTLGALNFIVRGLRELPGRKSVVLFSDGFPIRREDGSSGRTDEALRRLIDLANRASVVIYTIDARGLQTTGLTAADNTGRMRPDQVARVLSDRSAELFETQSGLQYLAQQTGGLAFRNNNDISGGVRRALEDQKGYYLIGYRPDEAVFSRANGRARFNKLEVRVRRPGLRVRTRSGFYGYTEDETPRPARRTRAEQMMAALTTPLASGDVRLRLTSLFSSESEKVSSVSSIMHIDMSNFKFAEEADGWHKGVFDVMAVTFGEGGKVIDEINRTETVRARGESYESLLRHGLVYFMRVPIKKHGAYQLRVAVRDAATERVGSASQFIEVPDLGKGRLAVSGIVMQGAGGTADAAPPGQPPPQQQQQGAMPEGQRPGEPDPQSTAAVRQFRQNTHVEYFYHVYNARLDRATGRPRLQTQMRLFRDGQLIYSGRPLDYDSARQPDLKRLMVGSRVRVGTDLPPGEYVLQVVVTDALAKEKQRVATQWIDFEIIK